MSFKKLNLFCSFDAEGFFQKKALLALGNTEWKDFESGKILGSKLECVIVKDDTDYSDTDGKITSNLYEKFYVKIPKNINVPMNAIIKLVHPKANVYGDFRNQLSVTAEDITVLKS